MRNPSLQGAGRRPAGYRTGAAIAVGLAALGIPGSAPAQNQPSSPIIVKIVEPAKSELSGLSDVLIGSLGLAGTITLAALLMGALLAGVMFWVRSRQE